MCGAVPVSYVCVFLFCCGVYDGEGEHLLSLKQTRLCFDPALLTEKLQMSLASKCHSQNHSLIVHTALPLFPAIIDLSLCLPVYLSL